MTKLNIRKLFLCIILLSCASCVKFIVKVDGLASDSASSKKTYILVPGNAGVQLGDLQFKEYSAYLDRALLAAGFTKATPEREADVAIVFSYGVGSPQLVSESFSVPIMGQTGVNQYNYPIYGQKGAIAGSSTKAYYFRYVTLMAYDADVLLKEKKPVELWRIVATSTGPSGDLRRTLPLIVASFYKYIATNTEGQIEIILHENDEEIILIKGPSSAPSNQEPSPQAPLVFP